MTLDSQIQLFKDCINLVTSKGFFLPCRKLEGCYTNTQINVVKVLNFQGKNREKFCDLILGFLE